MARKSITFDDLKLLAAKDANQYERRPVSYCVRIDVSAELGDDNERAAEGVDVTMPDGRVYGVDNGAWLCLDGDLRVEVVPDGQFALRYRAVPVV